jgi:hypothetical protein
MKHPYHMIPKYNPVKLAKSGGGSYAGKQTQYRKILRSTSTKQVKQQIPEAPSNDIFHALLKCVQVSNDILRNGQFSRFELIRNSGLIPWGFCPGLLDSVSRAFIWLPDTLDNQTGE